ncbi:MAG: hypothetical protein QGG09_03545, partial [Pirellulaceae bacterium]|nr:hypothetical protein [Pirellulaceae bacterium]
DGNLTSISIDAKKKTVFCNIKGSIALWPENNIVAPGLVGDTGIKGSADKKDVEDCIKIGMEALAKGTILKTLKTLIKKRIAAKFRWICNSTYFWSSLKAMPMNRTSRCGRDVRRSNFRGNLTDILS